VAPIPQLFQSPSHSSSLRVGTPSSALTVGSPLLSSYSRHPHPSALTVHSISHSSALLYNPFYTYIVNQLNFKIIIQFLLYNGPVLSCILTGMTMQRTGTTLQRLWDDTTEALRHYRGSRTTLQSIGTKLQRHLDDTTEALGRHYRFTWTTLQRTGTTQHCTVGSSLLSSYSWLPTQMIFKSINTSVLSH